ncbi:hypothetical protein BDV93DRAFT_143986 [Ceratobasidium sp. AG-I]|nr:hypothetical protein BDV93DRAFT_143986 [Ceratobasidium sp. AG-I]
MNGSSRRTSQSSPSPLGHPFTSHPLHSPSPTNATGLIPSIASRLRAIQAHNNNALGQAIAQLEAADDLQSELVNTRASYARLASDLRVAVDQNMSHSIELQRSREEVDSLNVKLRAAMEQMAMLESRVVTGDSVSGTQDGDAQDRNK